MKGVISVGAHYGEEYEGWLSLGAKKFIFIEPIDSNFLKLAKIFSQNVNVQLIQSACGNRTGKEIMITETDHNGKSCSLLKPKLHISQYPDIIFNGTQLVRIDTLDNLMFGRIFKEYDHLHIDTQGYELEVLKGAEKTLKYIQTIQCEVYREELYEKCAMFEDINKFLDVYGFKLIDVFWRGMTWGDAKYERK